ncbi:minor capsid protein [Streptomyces sp. QH1-20]|uniref:minor capsid protein n=1 Tax=Streptomyces sp. QH1-20 TaxID=3240934 RepID=UPI003512D5BA
MSPQRSRLRLNGDQAMRGTRAGAVRGLRLAAEHILAESRKIVPLEEGRLERSGTATVDEGTLTAAVAYDTPYAARQHEQLNQRHSPGRSAKYLERPMGSEAQTVAELIAAQLRRSLRG